VGDDGADPVGHRIHSPSGTTSPPAPAPARGSTSQHRRPGWGWPTSPTRRGEPVRLPRGGAVTRNFL